MSYSLSFTKGILVIIFISDKERLAQYEFLSTADISKYLSIPKPTLVKIMQSLTLSGIIETREGKNGGIRLAKKPSQITLLEIFNAIERGKPLFQTSFDILAKGKRPDNARAVISNILGESEAQMKRTLAKKTIAEILREMGN